MMPPAPAQRKVAVLSTPEALARACAAKFVEAGKEAIMLRGKFAVALSGGHTPAGIYRALGAPPLHGAVDWSRVQFFWSDERAVPADDAASNFAMAQRELLARIAVPAENVHRMPGEQGDLDGAARAYENTLRRHLPLTPQGVARLDLVLLGLGADGHTASLFPGSDAVDEKRRWVVATPPAGGWRRLTMTLILLNAARRVWFLVTGRGKSAMLKNVIQEKRLQSPAQRVQPPGGELIFWADAAAAEQLRPWKAVTR